MISAAGQQSSDTQCEAARRHLFAVLANPHAAPKIDVPALPFYRTAATLSLIPTRPVPPSTFSRAVAIPGLLTSEPLQPAHPFSGGATSHVTTSEAQPRHPFSTLPANLVLTPNASVPAASPNTKGPSMPDPIKADYAQGFNDGRAYAAAVLAGLEDQQRSDGYWDQARTQLSEEQNND